MERWLLHHRNVVIVLATYFVLHVIFRVLVSPSLDYDESEQAFLSQHVAWGYNSQPPLYTWMQSLLFRVLGFGVPALALLKNGILLVGYLATYASVAECCRDRRVAAVAAFGMLTIPQIAWESHRDLSHSVAATTSACVLFYCIVKLSQPLRATAFYAALGFVVAAGVLFKYNFILVAAGFFISGASIDRFRASLLDRRIWLAVAIAFLLLTPHMIWLGSNLDLASAKTLETLSQDRTEDWFDNVTQGITALLGSIISCCGLTLFVFFGLYVRKLPPGRAGERDKDHRAKGLILGAEGEDKRREQFALLLERFFLFVLAVLLLLVLSGHALEFKNRWLQPFVCLFPAYLALRLTPHVQKRPGARQIAWGLTAATMLVVLCSVVARPITGPWSGRHCWLNLPFRELADAIESDLDQRPEVVMTSNMRIGGNLRLIWPDAEVLTNASTVAANRRVPKNVLVVTDASSAQQREALVVEAATRFEVACFGGSWKAIEVDLLYGQDNDSATYYYRQLGIMRRNPEDDPIRFVSGNSRIQRQ